MIFVAEGGEKATFHYIIRLQNQHYIIIFYGFNRACGNPYQLIYPRLNFSVIVAI